ncbi:C2H2 finger domain-containing protein [Apiospora saccharicola]|uniref:C2H2 finger domain-containing protein n=1 Tax=Apiospora saccharicola TaxID=335842 RepID=A0ABR1WJI5_9PEZI
MSTTTVTRPLNQHRQSLTSNSTNPLANTRLPSHSRNGSHTHAHSALSGAFNAAHRVTRRKSMTSSGANVAAVAAALSEAGDMMTALPITSNSRRGTVSKPAAVVRSTMPSSLPSPPGSLPTHKFMMSVKPEGQESAIDDDSNDMSGEDLGENGSQAGKVRRASDGQPLSKDGKKSSRPDLRCEKCGKGYKHSSCLTKHLWEHTPEWSYTSKLLISKHQQVQLLEAASVLVQMNTVMGNDMDVTTPPDSARDFGSEAGSASPTASGYSEQHDDHSSADTTPPPQADPFRSLSKRYSSGSGYARSYQSTTSNGFLSGSIPSGSGFGHNRQGSTDRRPPSSGMNNTGQEDRDLAAAVELLSCSFNSNGGRDSRLPSDAPPRATAATSSSFLDSFSPFANSYSARQMPESFTRGESRFPRHDEDVKMEDSDGGSMDDEDDRRSRARNSEEDDEGVFGRMEE